MKNLLLLIITAVALQAHCGLISSYPNTPTLNSNDEFIVESGPALPGGPGTTNKNIMADQLLTAAFLDNTNAQTMNYPFTLSTNLAGQIIFSTNGVGSSATNWCIFRAGGITNYLAVDLRVIGFTGTSVIQSNGITGAHYSLGTVTSPVELTLQPGESLLGSSCAEITNVAW